MNLKDLSAPFPADDIEWRVSRAGNGNRGVYCMVLAYITARAIQKRLDEVCGPENWRNEIPQIIKVDEKTTAFAAGISIRINEEWVTKWDVAEPTNIEPAKGGFSGAMKRAGAQWGVGRFLYYLDETFAETQENDPAIKGWNYAKLSQNQGGGVYYWKTPNLPGWALPKEKEHEIAQTDLNELKRDWKKALASDVTSPKDLREGFKRFVVSVVGEFPIDDFTLWTRDALDRCQRKMAKPGEANGVSGDVPFDN